MTAKQHFDRAEAAKLYATLTEREIRKRQDLCAQQIALAFSAKNTRALIDLQAMADTLTEAMLKRV